MTETDHYDLIVYGGGMAGRPAGGNAAYSGLETGLVERKGDVVESINSAGGGVQLPS